MKRHPVKSNHLRSVGFEDSRLEIEFAGGQLYEYQDVPQAVYLALISDASPGKYLQQHIVGKFDYRLV